MPSSFRILAIFQLISLWFHRSSGWLSPGITSQQSKAPRFGPTRIFSASPALSPDHIQELKEKDYVVIPNFISEALQASLRDDVIGLRANDFFRVAKIGQDSTNNLDTNIRVAETCFLGRDKDSLPAHQDRQLLYERLDQVRSDLQVFGPLDAQLTELLYAYYPLGGFYRRHRDAIPGSASVLRSYSMLLYLNKDWNAAQDAGELRMHFDSGGDELPEGEIPNFMDVEPNGGTLVLFKSDAVPHEVLDTQKERFAVVGWFNRPMSVSDISELSDGSSTQMLLMTVAAALVTVGAIQLLS